MAEEIIVTNTTTGGQKGSKLARYDLIPPRALELLAEHYGKGSNKYTIKDLPVVKAYDIIDKSCTCGIKPYAKNVVKEKLGDLQKKAGAALAMKQPLDEKTSNMQNDNVKIPDNGPQKIEIENRNKVGFQQESRDSQNLALHKQTSKEYSQSKMGVQSATTDQMVDGSTLTMITKQENLEDSCVEAVIKELDAWETIQIELKKHPFTCAAAHQGLQPNISGGISLSGDRNWEKGYNWGLSFGAMMRHAWAFWRGEDIDPETGSPHLVAVAWHAFALLEFGRIHQDLDDRSKK